MSAEPSNTPTRVSETLLRDQADAYLGPTDTGSKKVEAALACFVRRSCHKIFLKNSESQLTPT
jgi:hypothetical protein